MENIKEIIRNMTIEEKAGLCSGENDWFTKAVERLGVPAVRMSDGPHGLRTQEASEGSLLKEQSIKAVCFPAACATGNSFDPELLKEMGERLGQESQASDVQILLGPGVNMKRNPLCGRNFEYFSEDPCVAGKLGTAFVKGVQSQGVGTSLKHFFANNQETRRMEISSEVDERTKREYYLPAFEQVIKEAKPVTVMAAYNKIDGTFATESRKYLTDVLRKEWGYEGVVVSDWGAVHNRVKAVEAGTDITMPSATKTDRKLVEAVEKGELAESVLDEACERILFMVKELTENKQENVTFDYESDHAFARKVAAESMVLLKNEDQILPISGRQKVAFIGAYAKNPRYQGGGSSHVNSYKVIGAYDAVIAEGFAEENNLSYADGYAPYTKELDQSAVIEAVSNSARPDDKFENDVDEALIIEAVSLAKEADVAVIFAGLPELMESEGFDRKDMKMPESHVRLIEAVTKSQPNTAVVLYNGSAIELPWANRVKAILEAYLPGEAAGEATVDILYGKVNPSGHLAESFPVRLEDNPSYLIFPGDKEGANYNERMFVGYRYYESKKVDVRFPFGHGLSYTEFAFSNLHIEKERLQGRDSVEVRVDVTNIGSRGGSEVVQLYVAPSKGSLPRPVRELRDFEKVNLEVGETKTVSFKLESRDFAYWSVAKNDWALESGECRIQIGRSSHDIVLEESISIDAGDMKEKVFFTLQTPMKELFATERGKQFWDARVCDFIRGVAAYGVIPAEAAEALLANPAVISQMPQMDHLYMQSISLIAAFCGNVDEEELEALCAELNA
ncbi:beta-glucosidase family protein [Anaerobium acetethylicum]|uniref:Beta-glucosidase n=1 Tax=Anaerobium acetethylicum TaxID=1619234 RepID=A0A1D3TNG0_9FIRM|nr:glycoside hydrolase family 3 C-terminal domain-containing protein [Anaerobium acetethylicum]SCP94841.1 beta-glucosidase [Anaerobium acetethylicum]